MAEGNSIERLERGGAKDWLAGLEEGDMSPSKITAVMMLGALGSLALYYIYASLSQDTRDNLKDQMISTVKSNINKFTQG